MQNPNHSHSVLDTDKIGRLLFKLSVPMFFGMLVQSIYNIVDTIFIGHFAGSLGIATLSIIFPIQMMVVGVGTMVSVGGASLISRLLGGSEQDRAERALGNSITFAVIFALILTLGVVPFADFWLKIIGTSENVLPFARNYLIITMAGTIFNLAGAVLLSLARAEGNARVSMISLILQSVLNIILDAVFMIPLGMGVSGAALATVISQAIALAYVMSYYLTGDSYLKLYWRNFIPDMKVVKSIFAIGISQFVQAIATSISVFLLIRMMATYGGDMALSAFGIIQRVMMLSSMPGMVLGQAMQPILGFNYGAKRYRMALKTIYLASFTAFAFSLIAFLVLVIFPEPIVKIFTSDPELIDVAAYATRLMFVALPLLGFFSVGQLIFPSIGKAVQTFIISLARPALFLTPLILIMSYFFKMNGVWLSFPTSDALTFLLTVGLLIPLIRNFRRAAAGEKTENPAVPVKEPAA